MKIRFRRVLDAAIRAAAEGLLLVSLAATAFAQSSKDDQYTDQETFTDTRESDRRGFDLLQFQDGKESGQAAVVAREFVAKIAKLLPDPQPGFAYAMKDLDGDGGPELFLRIMHWTLCESGCPVHIYRFDLTDKSWKELTIVYASLLAIRTPRKQGERPEIAVMSDGPDGRGPTTTTYYRWDANDHFVKETKGAAEKQERRRK